MDVITLDFESFWDSDYSLSKLSPLAYVLGDRFELHSCTIKFNGTPTDVFFGHGQVQEAFKRINKTVESSMLVAHNNAGFDAYISAFVLGLKPRMWGCTQAMARPIHAKTVGLSLAKLVAHYGIGVKNNAVLLQTKGKRLADFTEQELRDMETYNREDTDQCWALFNILKTHYTPAELWQIDALVRMRVEPKFVVDTGLLETALSIERSNKHKHLMGVAKLLREDENVEVDEIFWEDEDTVAEFVRSELASAPKFSKILESRGVEVPMKPSPTNPEKLVPALAKTDEAFTELQEHDDPIVAAAARARLAVKSTLLETRIGKFQEAAKLAGGLLPVPLVYCGADTTGRDSGCLVDDTQVLVYDSLTGTVQDKRIVDVLAADLVWDGEEFVAHDGVAFSGYAEVITWDGVTGTKDHVVFTEVGEISLSAARARGVPITPAGRPTAHQVEAARKYADDY